MIFFVISIFLNLEEACLLTNFLNSFIHKPEKYVLFEEVIKPASFLVDFYLTIFVWKGSILSHVVAEHSTLKLFYWIPGRIKYLL